MTRDEWKALKFQSTLPAREATAARLDRKFIGIISIHASREGSDMSTKCKEGHRGISIHASREGSDYPARLPAVFQCRFQSTLPAREATAILRDRLEKQKISIHASREGSDFSSASASLKSWHISIHASREGSDSFHCSRCSLRY